MAALLPPFAAVRARLRAAAFGGTVLIALGGLLAAGCSAGSTSAPSATARMAAGSAAVAGGAVGTPAHEVSPGTPGANLAALSLGQSIVYTASLTVRARDVGAAAARAARYAVAAGGYVSNEEMYTARGHQARASVSLQLKIPVAAYPAALSTLSSTLGARISLSQQARDVTQAVADVTSRVASAQAAIAQLRRLLARAGTVSSLLRVQEQINQQESGLEALLAQQRALAHETSYATVSLLLVSPPPAATAHHRGTRPAGFLGGLSAGWRALRVALSWLVTVAGAVLPFAVILALAALLGYQGWRRLARHRTPPRPAD